MRVIAVSQTEGGAIQRRRRFGFFRPQQQKQTKFELLHSFVQSEGGLGKGLSALRAIDAYEEAVNWLSLVQEDITSLKISNPYLVCQTLWTRVRELQAGREAYTKKVEKWNDGGDRIGAVFFSLLHSNAKWGIPDAYAPLTSACMQTGICFLLKHFFSVPITYILFHESKQS